MGSNLCWCSSTALFGGGSSHSDPHCRKNKVAASTPLRVFELKEKYVSYQDALVIIFNK
jgi:hypothetical protein